MVRLGDANASASTGSARGWETLSQAQALIEARRGALFPQVSAAAAAGRQKYAAAFFGELKGPAPFTYYSIGPSSATRSITPSLLISASGSKVETEDSIPDPKNS